MLSQANNADDMEEDSDDDAPGPPRPGLAVPGTSTLDVPANLEGLDLIDVLLENNARLEANQTRFTATIEALLLKVQLLQESNAAFAAKLAATPPPPPPPPPLPTKTSTRHPPDTDSAKPNPKRRRLPKTHTPAVPTLPLQNRFAPLSETPDDTTQPPATSSPQTISTPTTTAIPPPAKPTPPPSLFSLPTATPVATPALFTTTAPTPKPTDTIPPIILHNKDAWIPISSSLNSQKINYSRATNTREGIRITPSTISDYRQLHTYLTREQHSFHSFQLPSEKTIKVVVRGVPQTITPEQILTDLSRQNYIPLQITRLNGRNNRPAPLILLQVERKFASIFNLKSLCGLDITVEAKRIPNVPLQCHRCQRFGHVQPNCNAPYRCLKCADTHSTHLCTKPTTTPAVCANCNASHISSHHSCPQNPTNLKKSYATALKPTPTQTPPLRHTAYPKPPETTSTPTDFATLCFPLFKALLASNPSPDKITAFTTQLQLLQQTLLQ